MRAPGACTLAMSGPTIPTSAGAQLAAADVDDGAAGEQQVERLAALRGRHRAGPDRRFDGIVAHGAPLRVVDAVSVSGRGCHELAQDAAQLDRHAVGLHVHLGREIERQPPVDVALLEREVLVDDLALERDAPRPCACSSPSRSLRCTVV